MDLERIKQNLRLRSGRSKKKRKASVPPPVQEPEGAQAKQPTRDQYSQTEQEKAVENQADDTIPTPHAQDHRRNDHVYTSTLPSRIDSGPDRTGNEAWKHPAMVESPTYHSDGFDGVDFDLRPPAPRAKLPSIEVTAELLFSSGHLNTILHDQHLISRFTAFLTRYRPEHQPLILRYLATQKAIRAVEYANAIAEGATSTNDSGISGVQRLVPGAAAQLDKAFEEASTAAFKALVGEALPMYITYNLVKLASESLSNELTGRQSVIMRTLVGGLSEVFCISDPNQEDNPIVYASEEFYRYTGYNSEDVIGNNCRFLQGPKTSRDSRRRLKEATEKGEAICETLLNYRRDGRPFINLLMIAPLHDDKGRVKYQIGAQVDVSGLVENGRGLHSFGRYLDKRNSARGRRATLEGDERKHRALTKLRELSEMFDLEESAVVQTHSRADSATRSDDSQSIGSRERPKALRRLFVSDSGTDSNDEGDPATDATKDTWKLGQQGPQGSPSGKLPGIYDTYMLIRPAPSLRIIFVSPKLQRAIKAIQSPFLSHVAAPSRTLAGLKESFMAGVPVSAKINFMAQPSETRDGIRIGSGYKHEDNKYGKACWISATPLLGSDERPGVWMVVFVEKSKAPNARNARSAEVEARAEAEARKTSYQKDVQTLISGNSETPRTNARRPDLLETRQPSRKEIPIKPRRLDDEEPMPAKPPSRNADSVTEVEDYHEAQAEISETQPSHHSAETLAEQPSPDSPSELINTKGPSGTHTPNIESPNRVIIPPSPDKDKEQHQEFEQQEKQAEAMNGAPLSFSRERSDTGYESTPKFRLDLEEQRKFTPPPEIDDSMLAKTPRTEIYVHDRRDIDSDEIVDTPVTTKAHTRRSSRGGKSLSESPQVQSPMPEYHSPSEEAQQDHDDEERRSEEKEQAAVAAVDDHPALKLDTNGPSGLMMDYLTHPGSGRRRVHAEEFGRALQEMGGKQSEEWSDTECLRTPYSVD